MFSSTMRTVILVVLTTCIPAFATDLETGEQNGTFSCILYFDEALFSPFNSFQEPNQAIAVV